MQLELECAQQGAARRESKGRKGRWRGGAGGQGWVQRGKGKARLARNGEENAWATQSWSSRDDTE